MMQDEFLAEYLANPNLQAKYGDYPTFRNFMMQQASGIAPLNNSKDIVKNKIAEKNKPFGLRDLASFLPFGERSATGAIARMLIPQEDPVVTQSRDYFAGLYGLDDIGRIQQGDLMQGYNPISGGFINKITGGKFGDPINIGLDKSYQKRIDVITNKGIPRLLKQGKDPSNLIKRRTELQNRMVADNAKLQQIKLANASPQQIATMTAYNTGKMDNISSIPEQPQSTGGGGQPNTTMGMKDTSAATTARDRMMGAAGKLSGPPRSARFK